MQINMALSHWYNTVTIKANEPLDLEKRVPTEARNVEHIHKK